MVTWRDNSHGAGGATGDTSGSAVKAQVFAGNGNRVGTELLVNTATASFQSTPEITPLWRGGFVVTWGDNSLGVGGATGDERRPGRQGAGVRRRRDARRYRAPGQHRDGRLSGYRADHGAGERRLRGDVAGQQRERGGPSRSIRSWPIRRRPATPTWSTS